MKIDVNISHIYSSPEHHYFTRDKFDVGSAPTYDLEYVRLEKGKGIADDRFEFSKYPVTFICEEVMREVCLELELPYDPGLFRRNIVISGINLMQLIGKKFSFIHAGRQGSVTFEGIEHCAPCTWMNAVMKKGAYASMRGRGGLRARVIDEGELSAGANTLITEDNYELLDPCAALARPRLP